jgi:hypothetical protein
MDELFWGWDHEDVNDWAEKLTMVIKIQNLNVNKLFKTTKLNLKGRTKEWFKKLTQLQLIRLNYVFYSTEIHRCQCK